MTEPSRRRRRNTGANLTVISWREIPAQVNASRDGDRFQEMMPERFQHAIDRAAAVANKTDTDDYVAEWSKDIRPCPDGPLIEIAQSLANQLDADFPRPRLEAFVANGGLNPSKDDQ